MKDIKKVKEKKVKKNRRHMSMKTKRRIGNTAIYVILAILIIIWLLPFVCILLESFRVDSTGQSGNVIPKVWGFDNYIKLFKESDFGRWYLNTFIIALCTAVLQTVIVLCMSYTLSRLRFKGRKLLMNVMLVLGMFPGFLTMIVLYKVLSGLNLTGAHALP